MNKLSLALALCAALGTTFSAAAANHTASLGYTKIYVPQSKSMDGINTKYRFEWDSPFSFITSFTYASANNSYASDRFYSTKRIDESLKYYSLSAGPAYRINEFFSLYGLMGASLIKDKYESRTHYVNGSKSTLTLSETYRSFMYGAGVQINPIENISLDLGYEGTAVRDDDRTHYLNGFNVGIGYRF